MGFNHFTTCMVSQMSFIRYRQFVEGKLYNVETTPSRSGDCMYNSFVFMSLPPPLSYTSSPFLLYSIPAGLQRFLVSCVFSGLYSLFNRNYPLTYLLTDEFGVSGITGSQWPGHHLEPSRWPGHHLEPSQRPGHHLEPPNSLGTT